MQRYLADEAVEARPPSFGYRASKFVRRHKGRVIAASLIVFALLAGMAGTTWSMVRAAERAERHAVIWRRISGGTDSTQGSRFVERMLTVVATCRQQGRNVLDYLSSCFQADRKGHAGRILCPAAAGRQEPAVDRYPRVMKSQVGRQVFLPMTGTPTQA